MSVPQAGWELPIRAFHWTLAALLVFSFVTGKLGGSWLEWHMRSGYAIATLLVFRVLWGFVGGTQARFTSFVRSPAAAWRYLGELARGRREAAIGHNPAGAWMVLAMLALVALQVVTGLFTNDESTHEGPLAKLVTNATVDRMSILHGWNQWAIAGAVAIHVAAIAVYAWWLRIPVAGAMLRGPSAGGLRALAVLAVSAAVVYGLVSVLPRYT